MSAGYATKAAIKRAVEAARESGLLVGAIEITPNGTIRVFDKTALPNASAEDEFDEWDRAGKL